MKYDGADVNDIKKIATYFCAVFGKRWKNKCFSRLFLENSGIYFLSFSRTTVEKIYFLPFTPTPS